MIPRVLNELLFGVNRVPNFSDILFLKCFTSYLISSENENPNEIYLFLFRFPTL